MLRSICRSVPLPPRQFGYFLGHRGVHSSVVWRARSDRTPGTEETDYLLQQAKKDYYKVLGVPPNATEGEIKTAYRKLAKRFHPDVASAEVDPAFFQLVSEAYGCLSEPESRLRYDEAALEGAVEEGLWRRRDGFEDVGDLRPGEGGVGGVEGVGGKGGGVYTSEERDRAYHKELAQAKVRFRQQAELRGAVKRARRYRVHVPSPREQRWIYLLPFALLAALAAQGLFVQKKGFRKKQNTLTEQDHEDIQKFLPKIRPTSSPQETTTPQ